MLIQAILEHYGINTNDVIAAINSPHHRTWQSKEWQLTGVWKFGL